MALDVSCSIVKRKVDGAVTEGVAATKEAKSNADTAGESNKKEAVATVQKEQQLVQPAAAAGIVGLFSDYGSDEEQGSEQE